MHHVMLYRIKICIWTFGLISSFISGTMRNACLQVRRTVKIVNSRFKHTLVLVRHGESTWNQENKFTGIQLNIIRLIY